MFKRIGRYFKRVLLGIDQLGNTIIGGAPDETISARAGRNRDNPLGEVLCDILDTIDNDHCKKAVESERAARHQADYYKETPEGEVEIRIVAK